jgi:DNA-binding MarR family transcriptional regulator
VHLVAQVLRAAQTFEKEAHRLFKPHGLSVAQFNVLIQLSRAPEGIRASDLARGLVVDPSNVTGLLKRMKRLGLVREVENTGDQRRHVVTWTPKGRSLWQAANRDYERSLAKLDRIVALRRQAGAGETLEALVAAAVTLP